MSSLPSSSSSSAPVTGTGVGAAAASSTNVSSPLASLKVSVKKAGGTTRQTSYLADTVDAFGKDLPNDIRRIHGLIQLLDSRASTLQNTIAQQYAEILLISNGRKGRPLDAVPILASLRQNEDTCLTLHNEKISLVEQARTYAAAYKLRLDTSLEDFAVDLGDDVPPENYLHIQEAKRNRRRPDRFRRPTYRSDRDAYRMKNPLRPPKPGDTTYCYCDQVGDGSMVLCDGADCPYEWFHLRCLDMVVAPEEDPWFCPECER